METTGKRDATRPGREVRALRRFPLHRSRSPRSTGPTARPGHDPEPSNPNARERTHAMSNPTNLPTHSGDGAPASLPTTGAPASGAPARPYVIRDNEHDEHVEDVYDAETGRCVGSLWIEDEATGKTSPVHYSGCSYRACDAEGTILPLGLGADGYALSRSSDERNRERIAAYLIRRSRIDAGLANAVAAGNAREKRRRERIAENPPPALSGVIARIPNTPEGRAWLERFREYVETDNFRHRIRTRGPRGNKRAASHDEAEHLALYLSARNYRQSEDGTWEEDARTVTPRATFADGTAAYGAQAATAQRAALTAFDARQRAREAEATADGLRAQLDDLQRRLAIAETRAERAEAESRRVWGEATAAIDARDTDGDRLRQRLADALDREAQLIADVRDLDARLDEIADRTNPDRA